MTARNLVGAIGTFAIAVLTVVGSAGAMESPFQPPSGTIFSAAFEGVHGVPPSWQVALGSWQADGLTYNSTVATSAAVTTIFEYPFPTPVGCCEIFDEVPVGEYTVAATLRNQRSSATALMGLVYAYVDPANYREVALSPTGTVYLRQMHSGQLDVVGAASYPLLTPTEALRVELTLAHTGTSVRVNGVAVFTDADVATGTGQEIFTNGQVGFSTYNTTAKFDNVFIDFPFGQQAFTEDFSDGLADGFVSPQNTFVVSNGVYVDSAVHQTGMSFPPIDFGVLSSRVSDYTMHVRMLNPYGGSGNLIGVLLGQDFDGPGYAEVVFSPTGLAQVRHVDGNTIQVFDSAPISVPRNTWFTVTVAMQIGGMSINVDGKTVFPKVLAPLGVQPPNALALITHWTPGRFDDFRYGYDPPVTPSQQNFDGPLSTGSVRSGTWNTQGGTLNDVSAGIADIVIPVTVRGQTDYRYKGRLLNQYTASGNLVGLVFGYGSQENYLEAVLAPTGQAYLQQYLEGKRYRLATAAHTVPANVWFDLEIVQKGQNTSVNVNGKPLFRNIQTGVFAAGGFGVVSHWSKARFDNLSIQEAP